MTMAIWLNGSVKRRCPCPAPTNVSALKPDQWNSRARFSTSGLCPCAMRISVEALTPERSATCFQFSFLSDFFRSRAFKNACVLNSDRVIQSTLSIKVLIYIDTRPQRTKTSLLKKKHTHTDLGLPFGRSTSSSGPRYILTLSDFGSYIGFSDASAAKRSPAISIS